MSCKKKENLNEKTILLMDYNLVQNYENSILNEKKKNKRIFFYYFSLNQ